jgi:hypothetical protein
MISASGPVFIDTGPIPVLDEIAKLITVFRGVGLIEFVAAHGSPKDRNRADSPTK